MQPDPPTPAAGPPKRWRKYLPLLGLLLLGWLLSRFDIKELGREFARVDALTLCEATALFAVNLLLKSFRWQRMLTAQGLRLPAHVAVAAFFSSQFYGQVTLGRLGELYRAEVLTERGVPMGIALSSCLYDRLLDVAAVVVLAAALSAGVLGNLQAAIVAGTIMLMLLAGALAVARAPSLARLPAVERMRAWLQARRGTRGALGLLGQVVSGLGPLLRPAFLVEALLWTVVSWGCYFGSLWVLAGGMAVVASRTALTASAALGALSSLLPVTISGLGAREPIAIKVLGTEGVPAQLAVVLSMLHLAVMTATSIGLGALGMRARHRQQHVANAGRAS